ncbi:General transcription factor IIF subunit 2 [Halotydeus destructor]|nr:General transcription factor IIF subunit 2 [Halotydeus destructor]
MSAPSTNGASTAKVDNSEKELDIENAARGVWLVKVPKYMASRWAKAKAMSEIGRLKITKGPGGKPEILFDLAQELEKDNSVEMKDEMTTIPRDHRFAISDIPQQRLAVFSHTKDEKSGKSKLTLEGNVCQKGECRPIASKGYMDLKMESIRKASQPTRSVKTLDKAVNAYKPVSAHKADIEFEKKKKTEGKKARDDKDKVTEALFAAFEKHQYYSLKDLEKLTKQPIPYLKEILREICSYNVKNPHKNMWELKAEYRHYKD